jgi:four helix bundle protein
MPTSFRELEIWRRAIAWSVAVHRATRAFPREESWGLTAQVRRASVSVASNIAEGHGRLSAMDFKHFLAIARGSLRESETQLEISAQLGYADRAVLATLIDEAQQIGRMVSALIARITEQRSSSATRAQSSKLKAKSST